MPKRIVFFKIASFSHINEKVGAILKDHFPDYEVLTVDLWERIRKNKIILIVNILSILVEYAKDLISGRKKIRECLFITQYSFKKMKALAGQYISEENTLFTIQTQSLFDASKDPVPHFLYTDHTFFENKKYYEFDHGKMPSERWLQLEKSIYCNAIINFTMSSNINKSLLEDYKVKPERVRCIGAGSNLNLESIMLAKRNYKAKRILFVGRRWERKGGPTLIKAFEKVLKVHPDASLTIIGCNPDVNIKNVKVTGNISLQELAGYYSESSIFCLPTRIEPFGIVFLEAMMYSLPVVATIVGAIPDFVSQESGILVEPNNADQLADALITLLNDPELCRRFGEQGFNIYQQKYTWDKVGARMAEIIKKNIFNSAILTETPPIELK